MGFPGLSQAMKHPLPCMKNCMFLLVLALTGCASSSGPSGLQATTVGKAITTPLSDLNLVRADIAPVLIDAQKNPYGTPLDGSCQALAAEVVLLDGVLGADLDTPATALNPSLVERGSSAAQGAATGAIRRAAEDVIPFRGWVRKLSGAERYSRDVLAAIAAGTVRRAYLKGLGQAQGCESPAAPRVKVD